jgi:thioredoxin reductase (NADPH)
LGKPRLERFDGAGVYYTAGGDMRVMRGRDAFVLGGGNSAGQAVVHLAQSARKVTLLVRGNSLGGMSDYLVREITRLANVDVRLSTDVIDGDGGPTLRQITLRDRGREVVETLPAETLFVLIGAQPRTDWLAGTLARDSSGFILTGEPSSAFGRPALRFETSIAGVFAVGDARVGSVKRVASAVGEGAMAVQSVYDYFGALAKAEAERPGRQQPRDEAAAAPLPSL